MSIERNELTATNVHPDKTTQWATLSPIAVLSKLVDSCRGGRELKPKPQMVQHASHLAIAGCFTSNDFRQLRVMTALSHNRGFSGIHGAGWLEQHKRNDAGD